MSNGLGNASVNGIWIKPEKGFQENALENAVCKISAISLEPQRADIVFGMFTVLRCNRQKITRGTNYSRFYWNDVALYPNTNYSNLFTVKAVARCIYVCNIIMIIREEWTFSKLEDSQLT